MPSVLSWTVYIKEARRVAIEAARRARAAGERVSPVAARAAMAFCVLLVAT